LQDLSEAPLEPSQQNNCCAELEALPQKHANDAAGNHVIMVSDPLEVALIEAVRSALPRSELEALVRMLTNQAPGGPARTPKKSS
jgi:hypothetical protein